MRPINYVSYSDTLVNLITHIVGYSKISMVYSLESFNDITNIIMQLTKHPREDIIKLIFYVSCKLYPSVAIFMTNNNMFSKIIYMTVFSEFTFLRGFTPLQIAIMNDHMDLVNCFIEKLKYFNELLVLTTEKVDPPLFLMNENQHKMLENILESEHCTESTLECKGLQGTNVLSHYCQHVQKYSSLIETLLKSKKCTSVIINSCDLKNFDVFELFLKSGRVPTDNCTEDYVKVFNMDWDYTKLFIESQYCDDQIVEKMFNYFTEMKLSNPNIENILGHLKYAHLSTKYNSDGSVKIVHDNQTVSNDLIDELTLEIEILELQVKKLEFENQLLSEQFDGR